MSPLTCARPGCTRPVIRQPGQTGRPPIYCSPACRPSANRRPTNQITVEIEHEDENVDHPHPGRTWTVTLRRGQNTATVNWDLGRFAAAALAEELKTLLNPHQHERGAID
jgi:hypothetical protein